MKKVVSYIDPEFKTEWMIDLYNNKYSVRWLNTAEWWLESESFKQDEKGDWYYQLQSKKWVQMFINADTGPRLRKLWEEAIDEAQFGEENELA